MRPGSQSNACLWSAANVMTPTLTSVHICTGWQSQGSAWKRYVAQAADAVGSPKTPPLLFAAPTHAPAEQAQPKVAITPEPPCGQPDGQAAREPAMPAPLQSAPATPALPLPVQLSLEQLQEQRRSSISHIPAGAGPLRACSSHVVSWQHALACSCCHQAVQGLHGAAPCLHA